MTTIAQTSTGALTMPMKAHFRNEMTGFGPLALFFLAGGLRAGRRDDDAREPPRERGELRDLLDVLRRVLVATLFPFWLRRQRVTKVTPVNTSNRIWATRARPPVRGRHTRDHSHSRPPMGV